VTELEKLYAALDAASTAFRADIEAAYTNHTRFSAAYAAVDVAWASYGDARKAARDAYGTETNKHGNKT